jgi:hypothetical protein
MPLDATAANALTARINDAFAGIGTQAATAMPPSKRNNEPHAWEYHVASHLLRIAEARKKKAQAAAIKAGIMFDHEKAPLVPGTTKQVYAGDVVEISVAVTTPQSRLDHAALIDDAEWTAPQRNLLLKLIAKHTLASRPPHKFTASLLTGARR